MLAVDMSNYTSPLTPANLQALKDADVHHVIVQAVDPPPGYPAGVTRQQIEVCLNAGLSVDAYIWLWFDLDATDVQRKLGLLTGMPVRQVWLDVEDTAAIKYDQPTCEAKVASSLVLCDQRSLHGPTGLYTGRWFWADSRYMGNTTVFSDRELWDANYDDVADAALGFVPYGGWTAPRIKQYRGTTSLAGISGLDLNVLSVAEEEELGNSQTSDDNSGNSGENPNPCAGPISSLGYIAGDLLQPVVAQKSKGTKAMQRLVAGIRQQADQQGIRHA